MIAEIFRVAAHALRRGSGRRSGMAGPQLLVRGARVDRTHQAAYGRVCGFALADRLPPTYPHVLAFPLGLTLMIRPEFPFSPVGLIHIQNSIEQAAPLEAGEPLDLLMYADPPHEHDRGQVVDIVTSAIVAGREVWCERSSYLRKLS